MLVCGINASTSQWCGTIFTMCYTHMKLALLLHKQGLVATGVGTTVILAQIVYDLCSSYVLGFCLNWPTL